MSDKEKIKAAVSKLRRKDPRVIAIRNMIALAKVKRIPGDNGKDGIDGATGADGTNGLDGLRGADGAHGAKGIDGSKGEIGAVGPQGEKGEAGMVWRGTYRSDLEYWIGDVVGVSGSAYVCVAATNQAPPIGFGWELLVSRGAQGIRGIKGDDGGGGAAAAGTLTGATLAANVLASSLTSVGTLTGLTVSGQINSTATTNSSSTTTGAIKTAGGIGVAKSVYIGQALEAVGNATFGGDFFITGQFQSDNANASTNSASGSIITAGGVGIVGDMFIDGKIDLGTGAILTAPSATALAIKSTVPAGTGVLPTVQVICPSSALALTSGATDQNAFSSVGFDTIAVQAATTYMFDGFYLIKTTGGTTHTISMSFALTTATITNCTWTTMAYPLAATPTSPVRTQDGNFFATVGGGVVNATNATAFNVLKFEGIMRVNAAGSVTPQITFSAAPGGDNTMEKGSYLRFYPVGANTIDSVGTAIS